MLLKILSSIVSAQTILPAHIPIITPGLAKCGSKIFNNP